MGIAHQPVALGNGFGSGSQRLDFDDLGIPQIFL